MKSNFIFLLIVIILVIKLSNCTKSTESIGSGLSVEFVSIQNDDS